MGPARQERHQTAAAKAAADANEAADIVNGFKLSPDTLSLFREACRGINNDEKYVTALALCGSVTSSEQAARAIRFCEIEGFDPPETFFDAADLDPS